MIKDYITKIVENGSKNDMLELSDILCDALHDLKEYDEDKFCEYKMELYIMAYGKVLNEDMAREIIMDMKPYGIHWTLDDTESVRKANNLSNIRSIDFWIVMNMAYNDYHEVFGDDLDMYIKYSKAFILDEDAKDGKVFTYFTEILK